MKRNLTAILENIKGLAKGFVAVWVTVTLAAFAGFTVFVGLWMTI